MEKKKYKITLTVLTGLHIGSGNDMVQIGGVDSEVIKDPIYKLPYIPGSSLKGKIRCLIETEGRKADGSYYGLNDPLVLKCFGQYENKNVDSPTRFIFRDLELKEVYKNKLLKGELGTESKTEINISRITGIEAGGLRTIERVPPTIEFEGEILVRYDDDDELKETKKLLNEGIELLNNDYLGGSGSRGYGAVKVELIKNKNA